MSTERGRVVGLGDTFIWLETVSRSVCGSCAAEKGCGQGLMNKLGSGRRNQLRASIGRFQIDDFKLGDQVEISLPDSALLTAALVVYLLPLLTLLLGLLASSRVMPGDLGGALGAGLGLVAGLALVRLHARWVEGQTQYQPVVTRIDRLEGQAAVIPSLSA